MIVTTEQVLDQLVSRSSAPSAMGAMLEKMQFGITQTSDPFRARDEAEHQMLDKAAVLTAMSEFASRQEFRGTTASLYKALEKIQRDTRPKIPQGHIAISVLRAYQEWGLRSQERGLVAVYRYIASIAPNMVPPPPKNEPDLVQAFREGKAKRAQSLCAEIYADSFLALGGFLNTWNKRDK